MRADAASSAMHRRTAAALWRTIARSTWQHAVKTPADLHPRPRDHQYNRIHSAHDSIQTTTHRDERALIQRGDWPTWQGKASPDWGSRRAQEVLGKMEDCPHKLTWHLHASVSDRKRLQAPQGQAGSPR